MALAERDTAKPGLCGDSHAECAGSFAIDQSGSEFRFALYRFDAPRGFSGHMLAVEMRRLRPGLPVLFTSGSLESEDLSRQSVSASAAFLLKPYSSRELEAALLSVLKT